MGRKGGKYKKKDSDSPITKSKRHDAAEDDPMNDEIDAFHNKRDLVPLDVNEDEAESDEDIDQPVFDIEDDDDDDEDDSDEDDETQLTGQAARIVRQQKLLRAQVGGVEEENDEDADEGKDEGGWGRSKSNYYKIDNDDSEDEEITAAEEAEALRMVKEKNKSLTAEDFGLEDNESESDKEQTYEEILVQGKPLAKANLVKKTEDDSTIAYEEVTKDLNEMTREEQMDVVLSSAPELVGLLSEFGDTIEHLENKVNPLLNKIRDADKATPGGVEYVQMKQQLLLSYCQAITFYLLLKSEGQPVRDHPVISRLVEIKSLLDKMGELDKNLPAELEEILVRDQSTETVEKEAPVMKSCPATGVNKSSAVPAHIPDNSEAPEGSRVVDEIPINEQKLKKSHTKQQDREVSMQSLQMLKVRAALEQKLREKGILRSNANNDEGTRKRARPVNGQLETLDDFDDDAMDLDKVNNQPRMRNGSPVHARKLSKLVARQGSNPKVISGDDDLPKRDDIGERRRKHELRVLAGAGIKSADDVDDMPGSPLSDGSDGSDGDSDIKSGLDFYNQVKQKHSAKLAAKSQKYSRSVNVEPLSEPLVDGKRQISYQMEKNRGLTPSRKKLIKNPRKKYKLKHKKSVISRAGQVREIRKQTGQYGGETTGINHLVTRSVKFKN